MSAEIDAMDRLIAAVKADDLSILSAHQVKTALGLHGFAYLHSVLRHDSTDAALDLFGALLPGWRARIDTGRRHRAWVISPENVKVDEYSSSPARALLMATLTAHRARLGDATLGQVEAT